MTNLQPLWNEGWLVSGHAIAAMLSIILGAIQFALKKGTPLHRTLGWIWVTLMAGVSLSSFGIHYFRMLGPFSVSHLLSVLVLYTLFTGIRQARAGKIDEHRKSMIQLYILALLVTGVFTLMPGRVMHTILFG